MVSDRRNGSYWRYVIAFIGITLAANQAPQKTTQPKQEQSAPVKRQPSLAALTSIAKPADPVEPPEYYEPCWKRGSEGKSDLCAQWIAAKGARDAAQWAWWQMWLSGLGVIGLGITLWFNFRALVLAEKESQETKGALAIAEKNANAALRAAKAGMIANEIAQATQIAQLRPYVYLTNVRINFCYTVEGEGRSAPSAELELTVENFGRTPAKYTTVRCLTFKGGFWNESFSTDIAPAAEIPLGDLTEKHPRYRDGFFVVGIRSNDEDILNGICSVFVVGRIKYSDGFGRDYITDFRWASTGDDFRQAKFTVCPQGNDAS